MPISPGLFLTAVSIDRCSACMPRIGRCPNPHPGWCSPCGALQTVKPLTKGVTAEETAEENPAAEEKPQVNPRSDLVKLSTAEEKTQVLQGEIRGDLSALAMT